MQVLRQREVQPPSSYSESGPSGYLGADSGIQFECDAQPCDGRFQFFQMGPQFLFSFRVPPLREAPVDAGPQLYATHSSHPGVLQNTGNDQIGTHVVSEFFPELPDPFILVWMLSVQAGLAG